MKRSTTYAACWFALAVALVFPGLLAAQQSQTNEQAYEPPTAPAQWRWAAHCVAQEKHDLLKLKGAAAATYQVAYTHESKSSPGETHIFLLMSPGNGTPRLFELRYEIRHQREILTLLGYAELKPAEPQWTLAVPPPGGPRIEKLYLGRANKLRHKLFYKLEAADLQQDVPGYLVCSTELPD